MNFFEKFFGTSSEDANAQGEVKVKCPFPHQSLNGGAYYENKPSAYYNVEKRKFYCHSCKRRGDELWFMQESTGLDAIQATEVSKIVTQEGFPYKQWIPLLKSTPYALELVKELGIGSVVDELQIGWTGSRLTFPVLMFGECVDRRDYDPHPNKGEPKILGQKGTGNYLFPYDLWVKDERDTLLVAGEKDCAIGRVHGFNTVTWTGGEGSWNPLFASSFKGKRVFIIYDNDEAGREGAKKVAVLLREAGATPHIVQLWQMGVCLEKGADLWDFFKVHRKKAEDLQALMDATPETSEEDIQEVKQEMYPQLTLTEAVRGQYAKRLVSSRVVVMEEFGKSYRTPEIVTLRVFPKDSPDYTKEIDWHIKKNPVDLLSLIETSNDEQYKFFKKIARAEKTDRVQTIIRSTREVFKYTIVDDGEIERVDSSTTLTELTFYSFERLVSGMRYIVYYYPVTSPHDQSVVGIIEKVEESDISVNNFKVTEEVKKRLRIFQGSPTQKLPQLYESAKHFTDVTIPENIYYATELFFHTPLKFNLYGSTERAYLDVLICGESRTGKSKTATGMQKKYGLGTFISGKSSTDRGLVGGSHGNGKEMKIRPGVLPRNNKGAVILEEFSGLGADFLSQLTDIRSSNEVRLTRVSGHLNVECWVRPLFISNQKTGRDGNTTPLNQYAHGVQVLKELLGADEDIARFDYIVLIPSSDELISRNTSINQPEIDDQAYKDRIRWVWSRKEDQITFDGQALELLEQWSKELYEHYHSQVQLFGVEVSLKLARIAIAVAGTLCSTNEDFSHIIVKPEHVAWARKWLVDCYDNELFRFAQYVENERKYTRVDKACEKYVLDLYEKYPVLMEQLRTGMDYDFFTLGAISGLNNDDLKSVINMMVRSYLLKPVGKVFRPSLRFRKACKAIEKQNPKKYAQLEELKL